MASLSFGLRTAGILLVELLALFVGVSFLVTLLGRRLGVERLRRLVGGGRWSGALKGIGLGFVTPFCAYSAIPVLAAMLETGVRTAAAAGFLLAAPVLDPILFAAIALLFGPGTAVAYTAVTFIAVLGIAVVADAAGAGRFVRARVPATADGLGGTSCSLADPSPWRGWGAESRRAGGYALQLTRGMARPLLLAVVLAAAVYGFVPQRVVVAATGGGSLLAVPAAALLGTPLYVSTEALLPVAAALLDLGVGVGPVFAFVVAAAGANLPEFGLLGRLLGPRLLVGLLVAVFLVALASGYLIPLLT